MTTIITCLLTAACLAPAARAATDETAAAKKICDQYKDAVVWISAVAKISISASDSKTPLNIPDREQKAEGLGTIIDASGMLVTALSNIDPTKLVSGREVAGPGGSRITIEASAILKEVKIILADGTEIPADVVLKDADLDLAFLRPKADAKEAKGVTFPAISLKDNGTAGLADQVVSLARADEILNRQPQVSRGQIITVTKKPREFLRVNNATQGAPTFTMEGKLVGIGINRANKDRQVVTVVLPAADVLEIAEQAKTAKPIVQEEKAKPAAEDEKSDTKEDSK
jgi:S1-C subfamily serine protease